jgi:Ca2+-binding EF-hand superfamily protein
VKLPYLLTSVLIAIFLGGCAVIKPQYSDEEMHTYLFDKYDSDRDGIITETEYFSFTEQRFGKLDPNNDGQITREELIESRFYTYLPELAQAVFRDSDTDGSGTVTKDEMIAAEKTRFMEMDKNGDGRLVKGEFVVNNMEAFKPY